MRPPSRAGLLSELVLEHPFAERFVEQLMVALYRSGLQAEALDTYRQARSRLVGELGTEPGPNLRALHQQILRNDPALTRSRLSSVRTSQARSNVSPNNLPRDIPYFTGRNEELGLLAEAIVTGADETAVTVVAIDGMAG